MSSITRRLVTAGFVIAVILPAISIFLPVETGEIENRNVEAPEFEVDRLVEPGFYIDSLSYVRDANPMRAAMIWLATGIDYLVLNDSPNPIEVLLGTDGWLYSRTAIQTMCSDQEEQAVGHLHDLVDELERNGVQVLYTIVPSKFSIYPEHLTEVQTDLAECGLKTNARMRSALAATHRSGYVDSWASFQGPRPSTSDTFFRTDTHFNFNGSIPWMQSLINAVDPSLWDPDAITGGDAVSFEGNLAGLIRPGTTESVERYVVDRGLPTTPVEQLHGRLSPTLWSTERFMAPSGSPAVAQGRTLWLKDSFGDLPTPSMAQYFEDLTVVDWRNEDSIEFFLSEAPHADRVIIEAVDEGLLLRFGDGSLTSRLMDYVDGAGS